MIDGRYLLFKQFGESYSHNSELEVGCGKTSSTYTIVNDPSCKLTELNASDTRVKPFS